MSIIRTGLQRKTTNVSVRSDLLKEAKELNINLTTIFDNALAEEIKKHKSQQWRNENRAAIAACNQFIEGSGLLSDDEELKVL